MNKNKLIKTYEIHVTFTPQNINNRSKYTIKKNLKFVTTKIGLKGKTLKNHRKFNFVSSIR